MKRALIAVGVVTAALGIAVDIFASKLADAKSDVAYTKQQVDVLQT